MVGAVDRGAIDFDTAVRLTRAVGQTMARLADWEVATLSARVEQLEAGDEATGSRIGSALRLVEEVGRAVRAAARSTPGGGTSPPRSRGSRRSAPTTPTCTPPQVTVGFADLVRFTALSNELDEDRIGDLVEIFESRCADVVAAQRGRVIKTLGDSVLFVLRGPDRGRSTSR